MEDRPCAHCGQVFRPNPRARATHSHCAKSECQRERRRDSQQRRRARDGRPRMSEDEKARHAARMRAKRKSEDKQDGVMEAGSVGEPAIVYVVRGPGPVTRLRVVTKAGPEVVVEAAAAAGSRLWA